MGILILGVILIPFLTSLFLKVIGKFLNELLTNFITLNAAMLSVATSFFLFGYIFFDKFKPLKFELFQWFPNPEINFEFYLDGLSGVMMVLICGLSLVIQLFSTSYMSKDENYTKYFLPWFQKMHDRGIFPEIENRTKKHKPTSSATAKLTEKHFN